MTPVMRKKATPAYCVCCGGAISKGDHYVVDPIDHSSLHPECMDAYERGDIPEGGNSDPGWAR